MKEFINDLDKKISKAENITGNLFDDLRDIKISFNRLKEAINYSRCCTELPMIEELVISKIRRKHQKQVDDEVERFLSGNGTNCRLRGFFSEPDLNE